MKKHATLLKVLLLCLVWAITLPGFAQEMKVSGKVSDANDGKTLPGVTVAVKGTTSGTITDIDGNYSINVNKGATLVFTFIGYTSQEIVVAGQTTIDVVLAPSVTALDEVVIIGYGAVKKKDATGSVAVVSSKDFNKGAITSAQELMVGKAAGVVVTNPTGAPGSGSTIRIRGGSSLNASNDPLIIVDGVPISNGDVSGGSNFMAFVNPNDIESFSVLKDASATAIYGSRASNGVIIITTKKGTAGSKPISIEYNGTASISAPVKYVDVFSGDQIRQIALDHKDLYGVDNYHLLGQQNTDWQKEIFRNAFSMDHNVGITGAIKSVPYRASIGYTDQNGILENTDMQRVTGSLSVNPSLLDDALKVNINLKGMSTKNNFGDAGAVGNAVAMDPSQLIMDGNSATAGYYQWPTYGANLGTANPVEQALAVDNTSDVTRILGNIQLDYALPFVKGLKANLNLATDYSKGEGHNNRPTTSPSTLTGTYWGRINNYESKRYNDLLDFYLSYNADLENISSKIDATAGYSWQHFRLENSSFTEGYGTDTTEGALHPYVKPTKTGQITENYLVSFFGRVNYTFMEKYLLTLTVRNDGSSRFADGNRWGLFPSAALAWRINQEGFLKDFSKLSDLKLRLGWGVTGQQEIGLDYPYLSRYIASAEGSYYMINGVFIPTLRPIPYDPNIKWEETTTLNLALDFGFFDNRLSGSIEVYKRTTDDLLNTIVVPTGSNFSNQLLTNVGSLENQGVELSLNAIPVSTKDMSLNVGFNLTYNKNEITKLLISDDPDFIGVLYGDAFTGQKQVTRVGYPAYSFFVNQQVYDANGKPIEGLYVDLSGDGGTVNGDNNDKYIYHNPAPDVLMGLSARFSYKNFDASFSSRVSLGNYVYNQVAAGASYDQMYQIGYWRNMPKYLDETQFVKRQFTSDYFVENASFFKMDNVSVGYKFDNIAKGVNARVSFTLQNAFTITEYSGIDPEVPGGIDNNFYPRPRTFLLGVSLSY